MMPNIKGFPRSWIPSHQSALARPRAHSELCRRRQREVLGANLGAKKNLFQPVGWVLIPVHFARLLAPLHLSLFFKLQCVGCASPCHQMVVEG